MHKNEIILFETADKSITIQVNVGQETVWLNRNQMAELFDRDVKTIGKHVKAALQEELDESTVANFATVQKEGNRTIERNIEYIMSEGIINGVLQEGPMHYSAIICEENQWNKYSHLIVGAVSQETFEKIDAFFKVLTASLIPSERASS